MSKKIINCKACGAEIAKSAKTCPHCGAKNKKSLFKRLWFWLIVVAVLFVSCVGSSEPAGPAQPELSEVEYKAACEKIEFDTLARNPENYSGNLYTFTGEVVQVLDSGSHWELRVNVTPVTYDDGDVAYYEDTIYVYYYPSEGEDKILEEDIITIYGQCAGEESYVSIFGETITLPKINAMYYELVSE